MSCPLDMSSLLKTSRLQRQKSCGGVGAGGSLGSAPFRGPSTDSQQSKQSLPLPGCSVSVAATPLLSRKNPQHSDSGTGGSKFDKRETFKWSGVTVSFDAESVKIENEVNGAPPGIKKIGKEVRFAKSPFSKFKLIHYLSCTFCEDALI